MKRFDVIIIGGGPSGTAVAMGIVRAGYSALLIERCSYKNWRLGETLPPEIQNSLTNLGVWDRFLAQRFLPSYGIQSSWGSPDLYEKDFVLNPHGTGWHLDRLRFDAMLAYSAVEAGARMLEGAQVTWIAGGVDQWHIDVNCNGRKFHFESMFLVDASGRTAFIGRLQGGKRLCYDKMIGIVGILLPDSTRHPIAQTLLLESAENGWWYSVPLPDESLLIAFMTDSHYLTTSELPPAQFWRRQLQRTHHSIRRVQDIQSVGAVHVKTASTSCLNKVAGQAWLAVGDAACSYDPLSSSGVTKALSSGLQGAKAIVAHLAGTPTALTEYSSEVLKGFEHHLRDQAFYYSKERRWQHSPFWSSRQQKGNQHKVPIFP